MFRSESSNTKDSDMNMTPKGRCFGNHPAGLTTLFFTEMWERFSYYGMRALLVLFMTAAATSENPGLEFDIAKATAIYGLYTSMVYLLTLPGGWVADKLWGQKKAVFVGGCIIAAGHFSMAIPIMPTFYAGLVLISLGTGLLKPNVSTMIADLYPEGGARRDAGFSIFYMGINLGAFLGTILCGLIGEGYNFHWGFSLAGIGMVLGLIQYKTGSRRLGDAGSLKTNDDLSTWSSVLQCQRDCCGGCNIVGVFGTEWCGRTKYSTSRDVVGVWNLDTQWVVFPLSIHRRTVNFG